MFGPGAIVASLTIGSGELIFSSRGGAIFGYSILWVFLFVSILKWALVYACGRHIVLSGAHPFERWMALPGARGWLPVSLLVPSFVTIPIWIGFLAGATGSIFQQVAGLDKHFAGAFILTCVAALVFLGGYSILEKIQLGLLTLMIFAVVISAFLMGPNWYGVLKGLLIPGPLAYPKWLASAAPAIASQPIWVEVSLYVGVVGGASYDYLAYASFLRDKRWGRAGLDEPASREVLESQNPGEELAMQRWLRTVLTDSALSFGAVILFSAVFVISGALALKPEQQVPAGDNLLNLQAEFVTQLHPWLYPLYLVGATLALVGTLYATNEVGPAIFRELFRAAHPTFAKKNALRIRMVVLAWGIVGGYLVLLWSYGNHLYGSAGRPPTLVEIVTPAALFTHVFSCALICFFNPWMDRKFLPKRMVMNWALLLTNLVAGSVFVIVGLRSYWEYGSSRAEGELVGGVLAVVSMAGVVIVGSVLTRWLPGRTDSERAGQSGGKDG